MVLESRKKSDKTAGRLTNRVLTFPKGSVYFISYGRPGSVVPALDVMAARYVEVGLPLARTTPILVDISGTVSADLAVSPVALAKLKWLPS